jgi:hypothetical protein
VKTEKCMFSVAITVGFRALLSRVQKSAFGQTIAYLAVFVRVGTLKTTRKNVFASTNVRASTTTRS